MKGKRHDKRAVYCVIGPTSPYRGGIAQYTDSLVGALRGVADVYMFSFKRQYPKILYPGETDKKEGGRFLDEVRYVLDSNNPLSWWATVREISSLNPDTVYISWWTIVWQPGFAYMAKHLRKRGIKVVYICHNIYDHDASSLKKLFTKMLIRSADGYLVQSEQQAALLRGVIGDKKTILVRQHPVYDIFPEPTMCRDDAKTLKLLFIGLIRPYKGLDLLIDAYKLLNDTERSKIELNVVGETWTDKEALTEELDGLGIKHDLRFVSDQEMVDYISQSDVVVLPYRSATGSGIIPVSYHCKTPVIATKVGGLSEVVQDGETGWLVDSENPEQIAELMRTITPRQCKDMRPAIDEWVGDNSWAAMADALRETFNL